MCSGRSPCTTGSLVVQTTGELGLIETTAQVAGVAIESSRARRGLIESERRFRELAENITEVFWLTDWIEQKVLYVSPAYGLIWGRSPQSLIDNPSSWSDDIHPDDRQRVVEAFGREATAGTYDVEYRLKLADGTIRWIRDRAFPIRDEEGRVARMAGISEDISDRKRAQAALQDAHLEIARQQEERLHSLTSDLLLTEERERQQLAGDLHDGMNQTVSLALVKLKQFRATLPAKEARALDEVAQLVDRANRSARSLMFQLSPPILHDLGFEPAVDWLVEDIADTYDLRIELRTAREPSPLDERVRILLFRAVRELLLNVAKHSGASRARVRLERNARELEIRVEDDGVAFNPEMVGKRGLGLHQIRERLNNLGGRMDIESDPTNGTRILLVAPLASSEEYPRP